MRFPAKFPLSLLVLIVAVPLVALLGIRFVLESPTIAQKIRLSLEQTVGLPVSYKSISVTMSGGILLEEVFAGQNNNDNRFSAERLIINPDYTQLLHGNFLIKGISLERPSAQLSLAGALIQHKQSVLSSLPASSSNNNQQITVETAVLQPSLSQPAATTVVPPGPALSGLLPFLEIRDGDFTLLNENSIPIVTAQGVSFSGEKAVDSSWGGPVKAILVIVGQGFVLHNLESELLVPSITPSVLLNNLTATLGAGKLTGEFSCSLPPSPPIYNLHLNLADAVLPEFFSDTSLGRAASEGSVNGDLQLSGIAGIPLGVSGNGNLLCTGAVIQPADFLKQIGQILQIQELQLLRVSEGKLSFQVKQGEVQIDRLSLQSQNLTVDAHGPVHRNGDLDLQARLLFNGQLTGRLRGLLGSQLSPAPEPGFSQVSFHVSGPAKNPRTDLLERLTGIRINGDLGGFLQGLFGHPSK